MTPEAEDLDLDYPGLTDDQRDCLRERLVLRRKAERIAAQHKDVDVGDVEHVLHNLKLTPVQRLARSLKRAAMYRNRRS